MLRRLSLLSVDFISLSRPNHGRLQNHFLNFHRHLTAHQTTAALRPFYFAVHPDLFVHHPKERAVNEDSMKKLQQYLESLRQSRQITPSYITFYVRDTENIRVALKKVEIQLLANTVRGAVITVLKSCDLSLDFVEKVPYKVGHRTSDRPIKWDASFYAFYGVPNPFAPRYQPKMDHSIRSWLSKNIAKAHKNLNMVEPVRHQTSRMVVALKSEMGLASLHWDSSWGPAQFRACLLCLQRLHTQNKDDMNVEGKSLIFCNESGISLHGAILLRSDDVQDTWLKVIKSLGRNPGILGYIPMAERKLSRTLNNIEIVRPGRRSAVLAQEYIQQMNRLTNTVVRYLQENGTSSLDGDYSDMKMTIKCATGSLTIGCDGVVLVPSSCPGFMIVEYLHENCQAIRQAQLNQNRTYEEKLELLEKVKNEFSLLSVDYDQNVTWPQTQQCCARLLSNTHQLGNLLEGCRLKIAQFYSVMSDGEVCIPWNWKGESTDL